jgi:hypothetical protein
MQCIYYFSKTVTIGIIDNSPSPESLLFTLPTSCFLISLILSQVPLPAPLSKRSLNILEFSPYCLYLLAVLGVCTQGFAFAKQAFSCLSQAFSPFCCGCFRARVSLFAQAGLDQKPPVLCFLP